jgi:hypothetical protein
MTLGAKTSKVYAETTPGFHALERHLDRTGEYWFVQANGAIAAGAVCKITDAGQADTVTTSESGSTAKILGIAQAALADNEWGWLWRGNGYTEALVVTGNAADTALTTHTGAGELSTGGDTIVGGLVTVDGNATGSNAVITVAAYGLIGTN